MVESQSRLSLSLSATADLLSAKSHSEVSIGLCDDCSGIVGLAGWLYGSWGYHGDDGKLFTGVSHKGDPYGPTYGTDDVVGCGFEKNTNTIYFTKNGKHLGKKP